jgi:hypothetical protein
MRPMTTATTASTPIPPINSQRCLIIVKVCIIDLSNQELITSPMPPKFLHLDEDRYYLV